MKPKVMVLMNRHGLDPRGGRGNLQQIKNCREFGLTVVLVSHSMVMWLVWWNGCYHA